MISVLLTALSVIPGIGSVVQYVMQAWFKAKTDVTIARLGVDRDFAVTIVQEEAKITEGRAKVWGIIGANKLLTLLVILLAVPVAIYEWKIVVWDVVLGWGTTDAIKGDVEVWMNSIIYSLFGSATALAAVQAWWTTRD